MAPMTLTLLIAATLAVNCQALMCYNCYSRKQPDICTKENPKTASMSNCTDAKEYCYKLIYRPDHGTPHTTRGCDAGSFDGDFQRIIGKLNKLDGDGCVYLHLEVNDIKYDSSGCRCSSDLCNSAPAVTSSYSAVLTIAAVTSSLLY